MTYSRRGFLRTALTVGGALINGAWRRPDESLPSEARNNSTFLGAPLNILVLGGTGFIGPHFVRHAVARGHKVTIFTRGRRDGELPTGVERLVGDRMINDTIPRGDLRALEGRRWDAVIDDSATDPRWVRQSVDLLKDSGMYLFVSSTGVFDPYLANNLDEGGPVRLEPAGSREYAVQKAQGERVVLDSFGARGVVVRPTYIVGPGDTTDRFPYWPQRLARGGDVLAPGRKSDPVQIIDVRDLAEFKVKLIEEKRGGVFNVAGPRETLSMERFLNESRAAIGSTARLIWVENYEVLTQQRISFAIPWIMLSGTNMYSTTIRNGKALAAGLNFRPLATTVRDTLDWWRTVPEARQTGARFWITKEREAEVLAAVGGRG